jgi:hypothetical protein
MDPETGLYSVVRKFNSISEKVIEAIFEDQRAPYRQSNETSIVESEICLNPTRLVLVAVSNALLIRKFNLAKKHQALQAWSMVP